jgi:hypothetical protein
VQPHFDIAYMLYTSDGLVILWSLRILEQKMFSYVGYVFDEFRDTFFKNSANWGKLQFHYGRSGNWRTTIQLFRQLDNTKLHSR